MTPRERVLTAISGEKPDRVPVCPFIARRFANKLVGRFDWRGVLEANKKVGSIAFSFQQAEPKFYLHWPKGWGEVTQIVGLPKGKIIEETRIYTPYGNLQSKRWWNYFWKDPACSKIVEYLIKRREDYEVYLKYAEQWIKAAEWDLSECVEAAEEIGDDGVLSSWRPHEFQWAGNLRGMDRYLVDFYDAPDLMREVLTGVRKIKELEFQAFNESPAEVLILDVCWASTSIVSPDFFKEWIVPGLRWTTEAVAKDKYVGFFMSGKMKEVLPLMVEAGPDFIDGFDLVSGDVSMRDAKQKFGNKICIMGNYNPVILARGSKEQAEAETLRCLEESAEGGGYILATSDEVPADAKVENMRVMVDVASRYGY